MRQVPYFLLIGAGRLSSHLQRYFNLLNLRYDVWSRTQSVSQLNTLSQQATHILILISDTQIENFITQYLMETSAVRIHCSGSLVTDKAFGAHPLQTFGYNLYDLKTYQQIPFVIDEHAPDFSELFPGLNNRHARLASSLKAKYHALCVLSGNFSCLLWQTFFNKLTQELNLPSDFAHEYLIQQTKNLMVDYQSALTGPLVRQDQVTIHRNIKSLDKDPLQKLYLAFVNYYAETHS